MVQMPITGSEIFFDDASIPVFNGGDALYVSEPIPSFKTNGQVAERE